MTKTYLAGWGNGYVTPTVGQRELKDFNNGMGYDPNEIEAISRLNVGEVHSFSGTPSGDHVVVRLQDDVLLDTAYLAEIDAITATAEEFASLRQTHSDWFEPAVAPGTR